MFDWIGLLFRKLFFGAGCGLLCAALSGMAGCARMESPPGGPEDETPPSIVIRKPAHKAVRVPVNTVMHMKWSEAWQGHVEGDTYETPFNLDDMPVSFTTYDLDFVRRKHLGF